MTKPTRTQIAQYNARTTALRIALANMLNPDPESLSRSYGLPIADVERIVRSFRHG